MALEKQQAPNIDKLREMMIKRRPSNKFILSIAALHFGIACAVTLGSGSAVGVQIALPEPSPLLEKNQPVVWWFAYKFNSQFPACGKETKRVCLFGGKVQP